MRVFARRCIIYILLIMLAFIFLLNLSLLWSIKHMSNKMLTTTKSKQALWLDVLKVDNNDATHSRKTLTHINTNNIPTYAKETMTEKKEYIKFSNDITTSRASKVDVNIQTTETKQKIVLDLTNKELYTRGLQVDWWYDICSNKTTANSKWHPLFPTIPSGSTIIYKLADDAILHLKYLRRIYGFLFTNISAMFDFKFSARDGIEILLADTGMTLQNFSNDFNVSMATGILHHGMRSEDIIKQDKVIPALGLFTSYENNIKLQAQQIYFVEIIQGGNSYGGMKVEWRTNNNSFQVINNENLFMLNNNILQNRNQLSVLYNTNKPKIKFQPDMHEINRLNFHNIPRMEISKLFENKSLFCDPVALIHRNIKLYDGKLYVDRILVYPMEYFDFTGGWPDKDLLLSKNEAKNISNDVIKELQTHLDRSIELKSIVHIEKSIEPSFHVYRDWKKTLYFVELDIISNNDVKNIHRTSLYVRQNTIDKRICFVKEYNQWSHRVTINILTPVRNQAIWIEYLLRTLEHVLNTTNENNIRLIMIDYNSTDINVHNLLKSHSVPFDYVKVKENTFNKVKALNIGLNHVTDDASIVFVMDLHLQIPLNIFERMRKHTIQHYTAFCPTLLKFQCGQHEQYTRLERSLWIDDGFGMMAMYKSDWIKVGGFNEKMFSNQWGGEDWELTDRIVASGIYLFHNRLPRFYHIYHNSHGTWDGNHF